MPSVSKKQHRAMAAACYGESKVGIPKKVACEYVQADKAKTKHTTRRKTPR